MAEGNNTQGKVYINRKERESKFELLRIVAILMITIHHLTINGIDACGYNALYIPSTKGLIGAILNSFCICGVNLFILISGWYGIKHITRNTIRLIIDCAIFGIAAYLYGIIIGQDELSISLLWKSARFTSSWYVVNYIILMLASPIIESAISNVKSIHNFTKWIILLTICNIYFGYYLGRINIDGYNAINFIYLYVLGRYLNYMSCKIEYTKACKWGGGIYIICSLLLGLMFYEYAKYFHPLRSLHYWSYNNPLIILQSIALFCFFSTTQIKSSIINFCASAVLGIYLLQSNPFVGPTRNIIVQTLYNKYGFVSIPMFAVVLMVIFGAVTITLNYIRKPLIIGTNLIITLLRSYISEMIHHYGTSD